MKFLLFYMVLSSKYELLVVYFAIYATYDQTIIIMQNKYKLYIIVKNFQNSAKNSFVPSTKIKHHIQYTLKY